MLNLNRNKPRPHVPANQQAPPVQQQPQRQQILGAPQQTPSNAPNTVYKRSYYYADAYTASIDSENGGNNGLVIFTQDGRAIACPNCCTSLITQPKLKLFYSSCCGKVLCEPCKKQLITTTERRCDTPECSGYFTTRTGATVPGAPKPAQWTEQPINQSRYNDEAARRHGLGAIGQLEECDFTTGRYAEYCEDLQSLVYDMLYSKEPTDGSENALKRKYEQELENRRKRVGRNDQVDLAGLRQLTETSTLQNNLPTAQQQQLQLQPQQIIPPHLKGVSDLYIRYRQNATNINITVPDNDPGELANTVMKEMGLDPTAPGTWTKEQRVALDARLKPFESILLEKRKFASSFQDHAYTPLTQQYLNIDQILCQDDYY